MPTCSKPRAQTMLTYHHKQEEFNKCVYYKNIIEVVNAYLSAVPEEDTTIDIEDDDIVVNTASTNTSSTTAAALYSSNNEEAVDVHDFGVDDGTDNEDAEDVDMDALRHAQ